MWSKWRPQLANGVKEDQLGEFDITNIQITALKEESGLKVEARKGQSPKFWW